MYEYSFKNVGGVVEMFVSDTEEPNSFFHPFRTLPLGNKTTSAIVRALQGKDPVEINSQGQDEVELRKRPGGIELLIRSVGVVGFLAYADAPKYLCQLEQALKRV